MDRNLNPSPRPPWWLVLIQLSPLVLQLVGEVVLRIQGVPFIVEPPAPLNVVHAPDVSSVSTEELGKF